MTLLSAVLSPANAGIYSRFLYSATSNQTTFTGSDTNGLTLAYKPGYVEVYLNGMLLPTTDYTATNGTSIVFSSGLSLTDVVYVVALSTLTIADTYLKSQSGADVANTTLFRTNIGAGIIPSGWTKTVTTSGSGTYTVKTGCKTIWVRLVGGGGGGAGTSGNGGTGGSTTFGTMTAGGGGFGSTGGSPAGDPLTSSGGDVNTNGGYGYDGPSTGSTSTFGQAMPGCSGPFGGGGRGGWAGTATTGGVGQTNSGGGGGGSGGSGAGLGGMSGGSGGYCESLITSLAGSYSYAVGAGGGAGSVGGGAGGSGIIIIYEFY